MEPSDFPFSDVAEYYANLIAIVSFCEDTGMPVAPEILAEVVRVQKIFCGKLKGQSNEADK